MAIPGCDILEKLGSGGMATVFKARQVSLDRIVAVKVLSPEFSAAEADVRNFQTEAQAAAKLKHPGIIQVYDASVDGGTCYIVMEYIAGRTLGDIVREKGPLSEKQVLNVAEGVAKALDYAWSKERIIHCDVKPDNIMFDADGAVKVADLGLARTIRAMSHKDVSDEIMGTPAYISPEQAGGESDLDSRSDIYSLGATLYFLATGKDMFDAPTATQILKKQLSETAVHPADINPKLSKQFCSLIEKMLARDRAQRQKDWSAVLSDLARVKKKRPPHHPILVEGASAVRKARQGPDKVVVASKSKPQRVPMFKNAGSRPSAAAPVPAAIPDAPRKSPVPLIVLGVLLLALMLMIPRVGRTVRRRDHFLQQSRLEAQAEQDRLDRLRSAFESAQSFEKANPDLFDGNVARYLEVAEQGRGTDYESRARQAAQRAREAKQRRHLAVMSALRQEVAALVEQGHLADAVDRYENYAGLLAAETAEQRMNLAAGLRQEMEQQDALRRERDLKAEAAWRQTLADTVFRLMTRGVGSALVLMESALASDVLAEKRAEVETVKRLLEEASKVDRAVLAWFAARKGQTIRMEVAGEQREFTIKEVTDNRVIGEETGWRGHEKEVRPVRFFVADLSLRERFLRMGSDDEPGIALAKGFMMMEAGQPEQAIQFFAKVDSILGAPLIAFMQDAEKKGLADGLAEKDLISLMRMAGVVVGFFDEDAWLNALQGRRYSYEDAVRLERGVRDFRARHKAAPFMDKAERVLTVLANVPRIEAKPADPPPDKTADPPVDAATALRAAFIRAMTARNPGLFQTGIRMQSDDQGRIVRVEIVSAALRNIEALAALPDLREVVCTGIAAHGSQGDRKGAPLSDISALEKLALEKLDLSLTSVSDLSPLRGMKLTELSVRDTPVADIVSLAGMPLKKLNLANTRVTAVAPLAGLPLEDLNLAGTPVADMSVLRGLPLTHLNISHTRIRGLGALKDMPLRVLTVDGLSVRDFDALQGKNLVYLSANDTNARDLSALQGMSLAHLHLKDARVRDLSPLQGMPLNALTLNGVTTRDFSVLRGMPLRRLDIGNTRFDDVALLKGMPLERLDVSGTRISDIAAMEGMKLQSLSLRDTRVSDMSVLRGMPLVHLDCRQTRVRDYTPLAALRLQSIEIDDPDGGPVRNVLRRISTLRQVNGRSWSP